MVVNADSKQPERVIQFFRTHWDLFTFFVIFSYLAYYSLQFDVVVRQYPFIFLGAGIVFVSIEMVIPLLPKKYSKRIQFLTEGLASSTEFTDEEEGPDQQSTDEEMRVFQPNAILAVVSIGAFILLAYFIGFIYAIPIYVIMNCYLFGDKRLKNIFILSTILIITVYYLFGQLLFVPIFEGRLF